MPVPPRPLPEGLGAAFSVADAARAGVGAPRLRRRDLEAPFRGMRRAAVRVDEPTGDTPRERARELMVRVQRDAAALALIMPQEWFFVGRTAAILHGATVEHDDVEVAVFSPGRTPRRAGVRGRSVAPTHAHLQTLDGLPLTSPASTWAMLGAELSVRELVRLGDEFVRIPRDRRGRPCPGLQRTTLERLDAAVAAGRRPGIVALRAALPRVRVGSMSLLETDWRLGVADAGLPEPDLDVEVRDAHGRLLGIADGAYPRFGVLIEVEGDHHRISPEQWDRDIRKHADFAAAGFEVLRLTRRHINADRPTAPNVLAAALRRGGWRG